MLTKEQVIGAIKNEKKSQCLDSRDFGRLTDFFPVENWDVLGFSLGNGAVQAPTEEWSEETIKKRLAGDLSFAFEKANNQRGLSSALMYETIKTWLWILEDELQHHSDYDSYGLPLFKAVAVKYNLPDETE